MFRRQRNYYYYPRENYRRERRSLSLLPRRRRRRGLMKLLSDFLTWFFFLACVSGAVIGGGWYLIHSRFDDVVRRHVESKFRIAYPQHRVAIQAAHRVPGEGVELRGLSIDEPGPDGEAAPVLAVDRLLLQCNAALEELIAGKVGARQLVLRGLKLTAQRSAEGQWNLSRLLPLPRFGSQPVPIVVEDSVAQLQWSGGQAVEVFISRLKLSPPEDGDAGPGTSWSFEAALGGPQVQQLAVRGQYDLATGQWQVQGDVRGLKPGAELMQLLPDECRDYVGQCRVFDIAGSRLTETWRGASRTRGCRSR
jgi:hypothetical protein